MTMHVSVPQFHSNIAGGKKAVTPLDHLLCLKKNMHTSDPVT